MAHTDALRGYAHPVLKRDRFVCIYCGLDGKEWPHWLYLSWDHLLPKGHPMRDDPTFIVAACRFCNEACNRTVFWSEGMTADDVVAAKRPAIAAVREEYRRFWETEVRAVGGGSQPTVRSDLVGRLPPLGWFRGNLPLRG